MNAPTERLNGAAIRALFNAYTERHSHMNAFTCCSAHAVADAVPDLLADRAELLAKVERLEELLREAFAGAAVADDLSDTWKARVAELTARADLVSEYHVPMPDGHPLRVRRDPNSTRWAVSTPGTGIRVRIDGEWQPLAVASRVGVWAFPDVDAALDEAHRLAGGAL